MSTCIVKDCPSKSYTGSALSFYSLPGDQARRLTWLKSIQFKSHPWFGATVCSLHFLPEDYIDRLCLRPDAVPRLDTAKEMKHCLKEADSDITDVSKVCRICLKADRKTFVLKSGLHQAYSQAIGVAVSPADALPRRLCWECAARVRAAARLRARALRAQDLLTQLLLNNGKLTMTGIRSINRHQNKLTSVLSEHHIKYYDYEYGKEGTDDVTKVDNEDINECVDETRDDVDKEDLDVNDENDPMYEDEVFQVNGSIETDLTTEVEDRKDRIALDVSVMGANEVDSDEIKSKGIPKDMIKIVEVSDIIGDNTQGIGMKTMKTVRKRTVKEKRPTVKETKRRKQSTRPKFLDDFTLTKITLEEAIAEVQKRKESTLYQNAPYKCDICHRAFLIKKKLEVHMLQHSEKSGDHECEVCKLRFQKLYSLRRHMKIFHNEKYTCKKCHFVTKCTSVVKYHVRYHNGIKYQCPHCSKEFDRTTTYYNHLRVKHACDFVCELCGHTFLSSQGVCVHKHSVHKGEMDTTLAGPHCAACAVTFASDAAHARHLRMSSRHNQGEPIKNQYEERPSTPARSQPPRSAQSRPRRSAPVTCEQCGKTLKSRVAYGIHFARLHPGAARAAPGPRARAAYMCEQCGRTFHCIATLRDHKHVHTGLRSFKCSVCDKAFATQARLNIHSQLHSDTPPSFACPECGKTFNSQSNRDRHTFIHTGLKPFECEACGFRTGTRGSLHMHIEHVHNKKPWPKRRRRAPAED